MSEECNTFNIRVETRDTQYYDGDYTYACMIQFPLHHRGQHEVATVTYTSNRSERVKEAILKDIWDYIEDPEEWTELYIARGENVSLKIREFDQDIAEYKKDLRDYQSHSDWLEKRIQSLEEQRQKLLDGIEGK